jgi:UDP-N-acetylglucosamine 2-epimerase (non-hydrolysing)
MSSYFNKIPFGHVEAGLRTWNYNNPWPEEMNRVLISKMSTLHFCPTAKARENLKEEGIVDGVFLTGNTVIDSLLSVVNQESSISEKILLVTIHRRENLGEPLENVIDAILDIVERNPDLKVIFPVHLNPNVRKKIYTRLIHERIHLCEPMPYKDFAQCLKDAHIILTDSGGVQEEAPSLGTPVLVLRDFTERPESIEIGSAKLVGTNKHAIVNEVEELLNNEESYTRMARGGSPYGDGKASERILKAILSYGI